MGDAESRTRRRRNGDGPRVIPPGADPLEAVERIVPRRRLLVEDGDIVIRPAHASLKSAAERTIYELVERGREPLSGRFAKFEQAAAAGDDLARTRGVRLFFQEARDTAPQLMGDYRR